MAIPLQLLLTALLFFFCLFIQQSEQSDGISTNPNDVKFYLFPNNADNQDKDLLEYNNKASILVSRYSTSKKLIIYTSGFLQNLTTDQAIKNAYLKVGTADTANIIVVDWGAFSGNQSPPPVIPPLALLNALPLYVESAGTVNIVAKRIQEFISSLETFDLFPSGGASDIHLVGQSLGAHVMGLVGSYYNAASGKLIGRITGTEPAAPIFELLPENARLDKSDAAFVDALHTNVGVAGWPVAIGHVDFFINGGGPMQPECIADITNLFCSHNLAVAFYAKSILDVDRKIKASSCQPLDLLCALFGYGKKTQFGEYGTSSAPYKSYYLDLDSNY